MSDYVSGLVQRMDADATIPHLEWDDKLSVGVAFVDGEHKELVSLLNELHGAVRTKRGPEPIGTALDDLIEKTASHFSHEEALHAETGYPEAKEHRRDHEVLTIQVLHVREKFREGVTASLSTDVLKFLRSWLVTHIELNDRKFGEYYAKFSGSASPLEKVPESSQADELSRGRRASGAFGKRRLSSRLEG